MLEATDGFLQLWQAYCDKKSEIEDLKEQRADLLEALKGVLPIATKSNSLSVKDYNKAAQAITKAEAAE